MFTLNYTCGEIWGSGACFSACISGFTWSVNFMIGVPFTL